MLSLASIVALLICAVATLLLSPGTAGAQTMAFEEVNGQVVMEAENFDDNIARSSHAWTLDTAQAGYSGTGYIEATPNDGLGITANYVTTSPEVMYRVKFSTPGTYYVWIRGAGPTGNDDTVHSGIDGTGPASADQLSGFTVDWIWNRTTRDVVPASITVPSAGVHTFHLWMREDGMKVDKILLRTSSSATPPSATGPAESARVDATPPPPPPPPPSDSLAFEEVNGQVVMEGEHYDGNIVRSGHAWTLAAAQAGHSGTGYIEATPNDGLGITANYVTTSPEVMYRVKFSTPGTYYVWIRGAGPTGNDDTVHSGIDGTGPASADQLSGFTVDWIWNRTTRDAVPASITVPSAGVHTFHLWMREDGMKVDKILLRTSSSATPPSGIGPAESARVSTEPPPPPPPPPPSGSLSVRATDVVSNRAIVSWLTDAASTSQVEYGTSTAYGQSSPVNSALLKRHVVELTGLTPGTLYHYRVRSQAGGNLVVSEDHTFTTLSTHAFGEVNGEVVIEAEHYHVKIPRSGQDWQKKTSQSRYVASGYLEAVPNSGVSYTEFTGTSPELVYNINFTSTGTYYVWIRGAALSGSDDSIQAGIDGTAPNAIVGFGSGWTWRRTTSSGTAATIVVSSPGVHTFHLWMREDGMRVDRILLRKSSSSTAPAGFGPPESNGRPRLMAMGDSITRGSGDSSPVFGYRDHLEFILGVGEQQFVGTFQDPTQDPIYDVDHEGINGNTTAQVLARLSAALGAHLRTPNPPGSAFLLHIGTNDMQDRLSIDAVVDNVAQIINAVDLHDPSIGVYVALIIPATIVVDDAVITDYNNALAARLTALRATKPNLFMVDMNTAFKENPAWTTQYMSDAFHPNDAGYAVMGQVWAEAIDASP